MCIFVGDVVALLVGDSDDDVEEGVVFELKVEDVDM